MAVIEDGKGSSRKVQVDTQNRLLTKSITESEVLLAVEQGTSWNINTGTINLTSGNASALLYITNTGTVDIFLDSFIYLIGNSTGGAAGEDILVEVIRNPTTGTLIASGTDMTPSNRNYGSANLLAATVKKGAEASTITDGTVSIESIFNSVGRKVVAVPVVLPPGASSAVRVTPFTSNTSMDVQMAMAVHTRGTA